MPRQTSFGEILRDARERRGIDPATAARRLRIRPDILAAIEASDFSVMPPRGYSRNMINAYARYVGLDPAELTHMYLDELHSYETGRTRSYVRHDGGYGTGSTPRVSSREMAQRSDRMHVSMDDSGYRGRVNRPSYGAPSRSGGYNSLGSGRSLDSGYRSSRTRQQQNYSKSIYSSNSGFDISSKLPFIIAGIAILIVLIIGAKFLFGGNNEPAEENVPDVPISGLTDTSNPVETTPTNIPVVQPEPTYALFEYEVASGGSSYIEVYMDDKTVVAETVSGPSAKEFEVTGTLRFVTTGVKSVSVYLDGEPITLEDEDGDGIYIYDVDFAEIYEAWEKEYEKKQAEAAAQAAADAAAEAAQKAQANASGNADADSDE